MERIKSVFAAAVSGLAMADDLNCRDSRGALTRCDGQFYVPVGN